MYMLCATQGHVGQRFRVGYRVEHNLHKYENREYIYLGQYTWVCV